MPRLEHPGKKSYWHLAAAGRRPSEYAIRSGRLDYYRGGAFEVDTPLADWFARYGAARSFPECDWERFEDPNELTYTSFVARRRDDEAFAQRLLDEEPPPPVSKELVRLWGRALSPLRFVYHALQATGAYVAHLAPTSKLTIAAMFNAADALRRVQRLAYRIAQLEKAGAGDLGGSGRSAWLNDPSWQPARALLEKLLVTYDFGEALVALSGAVGPSFDRLFLPGALGQRLGVAGDATSARLLSALGSESGAHYATTAALFSAIEASSSRNAATLEALRGAWQERLMEALQPLATELLALDANAMTTLVVHSKPIEEGADG